MLTHDQLLAERTRLVTEAQDAANRANAYSREASRLVAHVNHLEGQIAAFTKMLGDAPPPPATIPDPVVPLNRAQRRAKAKEAQSA